MTKLTKIYAVVILVMLECLLDVGIFYFLVTRF